jgi:site-specific DNA-cytosine methylase
MKVLIACEFSGTVREAFSKLGHDAWSCDIEPTDIAGKHYQGDVLDILNDGWDMLIAFPPCTHLAVSGARHFQQKRKDGRQQQGIDFFMQMINAQVDRISVENPVGIMSSVYQKPTQIIQPWQFGHEAQKTTCLWLKNLPLLKHTNVVSKGDFYITPTGKKMPAWMSDPVGADGKKLAYGSVEIKKVRNKTFQGIADAMADQWGNI